MTDEMMTLWSQGREGLGADLLRDFAGEWLMTLEVCGLTGAAPGMKSSEGLVQRKRLS